MDLKQIEYIVKIADENNITRAAEKLFITQSALNQQLLKLEKDLGVQLFYRSRTDWHPTEAGLVYLENAREILRIKRKTYSILNDMAESQKGRLSVGFTSGRGINMFSAVYPDFHRLYPHIIVEPMELSVKQQQELISRGDLDIGFQTLCEKQKNGNNFITLMQEEIILAIPKGHPLGALAAPAGQPFAVLNLAELKYEPFVLMYKGSTIRPLVESAFQEAGFTPNVLFETSNNLTIVTMIKSNLCCGLLPYYYVKKDMEGMACFSLPKKLGWELAVSYRKDGYLSQAAQEFIRLAKVFCNTP